MLLGGKEIFYREDFLSRKIFSDQSLRVSHYFQFIKTFGCLGYFFSLKFHTLLIFRAKQRMYKKQVETYS
jgi:hypothetical protein